MYKECLQKQRRPHSLHSMPPGRKRLTASQRKASKLAAIEKRKVTVAANNKKRADQVEQCNNYIVALRAKFVKAYEEASKEGYEKHAADAHQRFAHIKGKLAIELLNEMPTIKKTLNGELKWMGKAMRVVFHATGSMIQPETWDDACGCCPGVPERMPPYWFE